MRRICRSRRGDGQEQLSATHRQGSGGGGCMGPRRRPAGGGASIQLREYAQLLQVYCDLPDLDFSCHIATDQEQRLAVITVPPCGWNDLGTRIDWHRRSPIARRRPRTAPRRRTCRAAASTGASACSARMQARCTVSAGRWHHACDASSEPALALLIGKPACRARAAACSRQRFDPLARFQSMISINWCERLNVCARTCGAQRPRSTASAQAVLVSTSGDATVYSAV